MVTAKTPSPPPTAPAVPPAEYTVVARRYRPQQFAELIGQEHVAQSLVNAMQSGRVAHAYLFTGARGVGKTSAARILAKALNCVEGPTATPCDQCDSCLGIAAGEDVDVLEIDGASNRGIDEARNLRANAGFRPSRSRYKIYIIDEIHMLTKEAFNALLKTLEEPPPHVKFIFATTDAQKLPITILSRCQRFDFALVGPAKISEQLKRIVEREGHEADDDALWLVARRAAGSMRDSQSLLDQLMAGAQGRLTVEQVRAVLGSSGEEQVAEIAAAILAHDTKPALDLLTGSIERGVQVSELADQLIEYWRALMLLRCAPDLRDLPLSPNQRETLCRQVGTLALDTILAGLEVWTTTKARMRGSSHSQVLLEMAVIRLCQMEDVLAVGQLIQTLSQNGLPAAATAAPRPTPQTGDSEALKKNGPLTLANGTNRGHNGAVETPPAVLPLNETTLSQVWDRLKKLLDERSPILSNYLKSASLPAIFGPNSLAIRFHSSYNHAYEACRTEFNIQKLQDALKKITGQPGMIRVDLVGGPTPTNTNSPESPAAPTPAFQPADARKQLARLPLFQKAIDALGAQIWHVDDGFNPIAAPLQANPVDDDSETEAVPDPDEV